MKYKLRALQILFCSSIAVLNGCSSDSGSSLSPIEQTAAAVNGLNTSGYEVNQGTVFLFQNSDCPLFVSNFGSCFGNNAAAPYILPQLPNQNTFIDPTYAAPFNTTGPNGVTTNIFYQLSDYDALITVVKYPGNAAYFSYLSYIFGSAIINYLPQTSPPIPDQTLLPDPSRFAIFGSVGNAVNNVVVQNQNGSPWNGQIITHVTTSNETLANDIVTNLVAQGINRNSILIEKVGSNVRTGTTSAADDMMTLIRYGLPQDQSSANDWISSLSSNVLVYKVSKSNLGVVRYPVNQYTARTVNDETPLGTALTELAGLLQTWSIANSIVDTIPLGNLSAVTTRPFTSSITSEVNGVPQQGYVGSACIANGTNCNGDNMDTSAYAYSPSFYLSSNSILFVAGVDHNQFNNSSYISLSIYNAREFTGVADSSQANVNAVGFNSGSLTGSDQAVGSAESVLRSLGIYNSASSDLQSALPKLYISLVSKNCTQYSINPQYCINLNGNTLIPDSNPPTPINIYERSYIRPGTTTGASINSMIFPMVIGPGLKP